MNRQPATAEAPRRMVEMNEALLLGSLRQHELTQAANSANALLRIAQAQLSDRAGQLESLVAERTAELVATNSQLEAFVYSIAHDLRAPLRSMQGFSAALVEEAGTSLSDSGRDFARRIQDSARFMDCLLQGLLAFSRIAQQDIALTRVDLESVVRSAVSRLADEIRESAAQVEIAGAWPEVMAHEPTLGQVITNLLTNALKFTRPATPPEIRLHAEDLGTRVRVWVEDHGIGIAPDHREQIFRLFNRLHGEKFPGTGIGLAIVRKGVERMGGTAGVEAPAGGGCRFWFELMKSGDAA